MVFEIPDDIYGYKHKAAGNFTKRQLVCTGIAIAVVIPLFLALYQGTGSPDASSAISLFTGMPIFFCGFQEKDGQPPEQVLKYKIQQKFIYPQKRKFVMSNLYETIESSQKEYDLKNEELAEREQKEKEQGFAKYLHPMDKKKNRSKQHPV